MRDPKNETAPAGTRARQDGGQAQRILAPTDEPSDLEVIVREEEARARLAANSLTAARHLIPVAAGSPEAIEELRRHVSIAHRALARAARNTETLLAELGDRAAQQAVGRRNG